jgi:hypothetical protein
MLVKRSFLNALATAIYISGVISIMFNAERIFGEVDNILIPIAMLMLFVLSASITGGLVLGKPILMYLNGQKAEGVKLFLYTIGWLAVLTISVLGVSLGLR